MRETPNPSIPAAPKPSILTQVEQQLEASPDGFAVGVRAEGKDIGAEISHKQDIGKPGGWSMAAVARWTTAKGKEAAASIRWSGKG